MKKKWNFFFHFSFTTRNSKLYFEFSLTHKKNLPRKRAEGKTSSTNYFQLIDLKKKLKKKFSSFCTLFKYLLRYLYLSVFAKK